MISNKDIKRDWKVKMWKEKEITDVLFMTDEELYKRRKIMKLTKIFIILTIGLCICSLFIM